ncbi:Vestitone reductase [Vitis vinifera]|uniref:Vestitone reductase n=1 Tax=Vitis vinifera TaxID=29760 RepID=A0A438E041_VITVI|nr:Vestitone reductase [Vitis vinifera]RVX00983.1 Vestitone reductase [Vitis vinifera]
MSAADDLRRQNVQHSCSYLKEVRGYGIPGVSSKKLLDTGFKYKYGLDEMFDEAIQCCKEKGFL